MSIEFTVHFWTSFIAGIFILLHIPSCNVHWANQLKPFSNYLKRYHNETLVLASLFALSHIILTVIGLLFNVWIQKYLKITCETQYIALEEKQVSKEFDEYIIFSLDQTTMYIS